MRSACRAEAERSELHRRRVPLQARVRGLDADRYRRQGGGQPHRSNESQARNSAKVVGRDRSPDAT